MAVMYQGSPVNRQELKGGGRMSELEVSMQNIQKRFGGIHALNNAKLELKKGEVLGLIGENGAGKSTLMKILSGVYEADDGSVVVNGKEVHYRTPKEALDDGICMIYQELNLVERLSVSDNIFIGRESCRGISLKRREDRKRTEELLARLELEVNPDAIVGDLTVAKQQMVEIAKGISYHSRVLIMDEPTAALAVSEIEELFRVIKQLKAEGISIIYISHRLEELFQITDRITVMRDGCYIDTMETKESSMETLIQKMVGRKISWEKKKESNVQRDADIVLEVKHIRSKDIKDISFTLRRGEILGLAGLMGAGRTELARLVFGADWYRSGKIYRNGKEVRIRTTSDAVANGISYLSEDRKGNGLAIDLSVADNVALPNWSDFTHGIVIDFKKMAEAVQSVSDAVSVKTPSIEQLVRNLSGGNQQKVVIAKWLLKNSEIFIFDEPTRGIDVGAKNEIYKLMEKLIQEGKSIIMISSEMPELLRMSDRILVLCEGRLTGELDICETTQEKIMQYAVMRSE